MVRLFLISLLLISLDARENPFAPSSKITTNIKAIQTDKKDVFLSQEKINFPSSARVIKKATFTYQNIDGSIKNKTIDIDKKINWHNPVRITHGGHAKTYTQLSKKIKIFDFLSVKVKGNDLYIYTKDKKIRNFIVAKPYKIVLDFGKQAYFNYKKVKLNKAPFTALSFGQHKGYYRMVIGVDGIYKYNIKPFKGGFIVDLKY
jgi:hypothetical protein